MAHIQTQGEWEEEMSGRILNWIRDGLYVELRFFGIALFALTPQADGAVRTFATDGKRICFSTEQMLRVFRQNEQFLSRAYLHAVLHCIFSHLWIGGNRDRQLWNTACDIAVEYVIDGLGKPCTKRILSWQRRQMYERLKAQKTGVSAAVIYRMLEDITGEEGGAGILHSLQQEFYTDDHRYWPQQKDGSVMQGPGEAQKKWEHIARQTRLLQEERGRDPDEGEAQLLENLSVQKSRRSYRDFLRKFAVLQEELHCDMDEFDLNYYYYGLLLYRNLPLIEPLESREVHRIREFVIVIDTSDSTSGALVSGFLKETADILTQSGSFSESSVIRILQCDNQVRSDTRIRGRRELDRFFEAFRLCGGGGTDFRPAFSYVDGLMEQGQIRNLAGLLYFTDGKGIYPKRRPEYKTAFLFLEEYDEAAVPPWAMRLRLLPEEWMCRRDGN